MKNRHYFKLLYSIIFSLFSIIGNAQTFFNIIGSPTDTMPCNDTCMILATQHLPIKKTTSYSSSTIVYNPYNVTTSTQLNLLDDKFSSAIPIGFDFCFYGNNYSECYVSSNGHLTFNSNYSLGNCSFQTITPLPYYNATFPDNAIFLPFVDFNVQVGGNISYTTVGMAPFRKFIIKYSNIPYFGGICNTTATSTTQCELNETYNTIEFFVNSKPTCNNNSTNWLNYATIGVQSIGASNFHVISGKNASIWTANNEAWQIYPNGNSATHVYWYNEGNNLISSDVDAINFCSNIFPRTIRAKIVYECPYLEIYDTITIKKIIPEFTNYSTTPTTCKNSSDGSIQVTAFSNYPPILYSIDNGAFGTVSTFNNMYFGSHKVKITDAMGCLDSIYINVNTLSNLQVTLKNLVSPICPQNNGSICVSAFGGVPPYSYLWNNLSTDTCINNLYGGYYSVTVTDSIGCIENYSISLPPLNLPTISINTTKAPCGLHGSIDITAFGIHPPFTYLWSNGATTQDITNVNSGFYNVQVTDSIGCSAYFPIYLQDTLKVFDSILSITNTHCGLANGSLTATAYNGLAPYTYAWSNGGTQATINNIASGTYTCTVTDAEACTNTVTFFMPASLPLDLQLYGANAHCDILNNGIINSVLLNATPPVTYTWSNGTTFSTASGLIEGYYYLNVVDSFGCTALEGTTIYNDGSPSFFIIDYHPPLCYGDSSGWVALGGIGGATPYKYSKDGINFSTTATIGGIYAGTYTLYVRDANSCVRDTVLYFGQPSEITITKVISDTINCFNESDASLEITATGGISPYQYQINNSPWQFTNKFYGLPAGNYQAVVKDSNNCEASFLHTIIGPEKELDFTKTKLDIDCYVDKTGEIEYSIDGGWHPYKINWNHTNSNDSLQKDLPEGIYEIHIMDDRGCIIEDTTELIRQNCCLVFLPNAFSPNGDGINDIFRPISTKEIRDVYMMIYNRWGEKVFESESFFRGWNGIIGKGEAKMDTYFYYFTYVCNLTGKKVIMKGDVTLVR